ncbi:hypothetical protein Q7C36_006575 [Tachysurus vachellii]|uniref:Uncharacterized protein n=1 Tax=Tachysurus vachellii TaxID=175792 RepID=A0AA88T5I5_TACVA|nr:hypothetical protein Q7C36_006575 [Tachysurus vachellii]
MQEKEQKEEKGNKESGPPVTAHCLSDGLRHSEREGGGQCERSDLSAAVVKGYFLDPTVQHLPVFSGSTTTAALYTLLSASKHQA